MASRRGAPRLLLRLPSPRASLPRCAQPTVRGSQRPRPRAARAPGCQRPPSPGSFAHRHAGAHRTFWKPNPYLTAPAAASMGSYLSSPQPALPPPTRESPGLWPPGPTQAQDRVRKGCRGRPGPFPQMPPEPGGGVDAGQMRLPSRSPPKVAVGPDLSCAWKSHLRGLWGAQPPGHTCSPVTVKIAPPERPGGPCAPLEPGAPPAGGLRAERRPDPCARETVLRALGRCKKGRRRFDGPLWFEVPDSGGQARAPEPRPSAFRPLAKDGAVSSFQPRPGPLRGSLWAARPPAGTAPGPQWEA